METSAAPLGMSAHLPGMLRRIFIEHPIAWGAFALVFFAYISRLPMNGWNVEILIARNMLRGHGFVVGPLDPPALWRPPLAVFALLPIEALVEDPKMVYTIFSTLCLTATTLALFYLMKRIGGVVAAHYSQLFAFTMPVFIMLVNRQFSMLSHLIMFATVFAALLATISAWSKHSPTGDARVGVAWGLAFLARPETILLFAATFMCSVVVYLRDRRESGRRGRRLVLQAVCFLLIYLPAVATTRHLQQKHDLIGQNALVTYYAGEYFASNTPAVDRDGAGYAESVRRFGDPAVYGGSLVRFAVAQPEAVRTRITQNIRNTIDLFSLPFVVQPADWLVFVFFGAVLTMSTAPPVPGRYLLLYSLLLIAASLYFLLFHLDPRYTFAFVLMLFFAAQIMAILLWQLIGRRWPHLVRRRAVAAMCTSVLVGLCVFRVDAAVTSARDAEIDLAPFRALAVAFRGMTGPNGTPAVGYKPDIDAMWISYFANTSIPWVVDSATFPRDRIYSFTNRAPDYMLAPSSMNLDEFGDTRVLWFGMFPGIGEYKCVDLRSGRTGS